MANKEPSTGGELTNFRQDVGISSAVTGQEPLPLVREVPDIIGANDSKGKAKRDRASYSAQSAEDTKLIDYVKRRADDMKRKKSKVSNRWGLWQKQFEALWVPYSDGRARVNVPLEYAMTEQFVSEAIARPTMVDIKATAPGDEDKAFALKMVRDHDWVSNDRAKEELKNEYKTAILGTSGLFVGYGLNRRVIQDPIANDDGSLSWRKAMLTDGKIEYQDIDMRFFFADDRVNDFDEAEDCVYRRFLTPEYVENLQNNPNFKNLKGLTAINRIDIPYRTYEDNFQTAKIVEFMDYYNRQTDSIVTIANGERIVRNTPLPFAHKQLPFAVRQYSHNPLSIHGRGIPEVLCSFKSEINNFKEMLVDGLRRSNSSVFAMGGDLTFDSEQFGFNNSFVRFNGQLAGNFQELRGQAPNSAAFAYLDQLYKDVAMFLGMDPQSLLSSSSSTATESAIKHESSLKRVNVVLRNRDVAFGRAYKLYLSNIQQFYPLKLAKRIVYGEDGEEQANDAAYPTVPLKDKAFNPETKSFYSKPGLSVFQVTPDAIRGEFGIEVKTNMNVPSLKQMEKQNMQEFVTAAAAMSQAAQFVPQVQQNLGPILSRFAFLSGVELTQDSGKEEARKKVDEMKNALQGMAAGLTPSISEGVPAPEAAAPEAPMDTPTPLFGRKAAVAAQPTTVGL